MQAESLSIDLRRVGDVLALHAWPRVQIGIRAQTVSDAVLNAEAIAALQMREDHDDLAMQRRNGIARHKSLTRRDDVVAALTVELDVQAVVLVAVLGDHDQT